MAFYCQQCLSNMIILSQCGFVVLFCIVLPLMFLHFNPVCCFPIIFSVLFSAQSPNLNLAITVSSLQLLPTLVTLPSFIDNR